MNKPTPGEWKLELRQPATPQWVIYGHRVTGGNNRRIAIFGSPRVYRDDKLDGEDKANAQLALTACNAIRSAATELGCEPLALAEGLQNGGLAKIINTLKKIADGTAREQARAEASLRDPRTTRPVTLRTRLFFAENVEADARAALALFPENKP